MATTPASSTSHSIAKFTGHAGTERILTKADQDGIIGAKGVATADLVWPKGNSKLDLTELNVHEDVIEYLKGDDEFSLKSVDVPNAPAAAPTKA